MKLSRELQQFIVFSAVSTALVVSGLAVAVAWPIPTLAVIHRHTPPEIRRTLSQIRHVTPPVIGEQVVPIVMYHTTPANFDAQLIHLERRGYTTVDFGQVTAALGGGAALPDKPVVITFDDGFEDQMRAFEMLQRHHMKATFYIINGGEASQWCIGAGRRYGDPAQPAEGCGDDYLTWDQVRQLDRSGLVTIGGHTLDHTNLPALPPDQQRLEITASKLDIEAQIGHSIHDFAYPYGSFDAVTMALVQEAGYTTAVTTTAGIYQSLSSLYTLPRIRDAMTLP